MKILLFVLGCGVGFIVLHYLARWIGSMPNRSFK
jgi:hypothetical protein